MWIIASDNSMIEWLLPGAVDVWTLDMPSPGSSLLLANGNSNKYSFVVNKKGASTNLFQLYLCTS